MLHRGLPQTENARVLYLDMNSFFASVEQQCNPALRNRPMAVVSHIAKNGTVLAASYEAKAFGIKTGTKVQSAREMCPELKLMEPTPGRYRAVHEHFMAILRDICGPEVIARSVDEAAIFLSPNWYGSEKCWALAKRIKQEFKAQLGEHIRCSIGIAPNALLGKVACNLQKPNGLQEISLENLEVTLSRLELTDLPGIAERMAARLTSLNILTPLDLYNTPPDRLQTLFGFWGRYWWLRLHGYEIDTTENRGTKSISHEHVLTKWLYSTEDAWPILNRMADRLIQRLERNELQCTKAWVYMSLIGAKGLYAEVKFDSPTSHYLHLLSTIRQLAATFPSQPAGAIRKVTLGFNGLSNQDRGMQLDLFGSRLHHRNISQAVEDIRARFGSQAIQPGTIVGLSKSVAKEHLGFGRDLSRRVSKND